ncbi:MAG: hypothetical protein KF730_03270 [Sphingomonas sp.]|uniref:hypothetical protein n=1 Tax=Sphingomonas sp. TaxID=28214 RepID=UPI0025CDB44D|nr:hypothetical protein [Sphingomonas sp.]MBX3563578.1 hypothetical protein [Sphingomonas sp.]
MPRTLPLDDVEHADAINREIERIRQPSVLGRSTKLVALFDYLVSRSRAGSPPREVEIMQDVFAPAAAGADDGVGRVYVHRLRRRLGEIYREGPSPVRIALPFGEYRLIAELASDDLAEAEPAQAPRHGERRWPALAVAAGIGAAIAIALTMAVSARLGGWSETASARRSPIWNTMLTNGKGILIAEGDYYLFGALGASGQVERLVRDFSIQSREDLDAYLAKQPQDAGRYVDGNVRYIPVSVARSQLYLSRLLLHADNVRMVPASELTPASMFAQNILYLGLTSGLGQLTLPVSAGSRFAFGPTPDDIRDLKTNHIYHGQPAQVDGAAPRRQYGLVSLFSGKTGNRYIVLAGTSEMGLVGLTETFADPARLAELVKATGNAEAFEALYQVNSQGRGILEVRLLATNRRDPRKIWSPDAGTAAPR